MKLDFARNMKRNVASSAINNIIRLLFPFLNRTLFLWFPGRRNIPTAMSS